jgi:hypothetical protein
LRQGVLVEHWYLPRELDQVQGTVRDGLEHEMDPEVEEEPEEPDGG